MNIEKQIEFDKIKEKWMELAITDQAKEQVRTVSFCLSEMELRKRLKDTTDSRLLMEQIGMPPLQNVSEIKEILVIAEKGGCLTPYQLEQVEKVLAAVRRLRDYLTRGRSSGNSLAYYDENLYTVEELREEIGRQIRGQEVDDYASKELLQIRKQIAKCEEQMKQKARQTGLAEDAQAANDFAQQCDSFEKKLHDLELTRMVSVQMSPQIRLVQNNDKLMSDKIQSTLVNTIPLWKSQMVLALGLAHSEQAVRAQREVTDMTNELLRKNADKLKMSTIETARETERGVVDMETLRHTNLSLIQTLDEVVKIQDEGRAKRRAAEQELGRLEGELKQKLLDIHS